MKKCNDDHREELVQLIRQHMKPTDDHIVLFRDQAGIAHLSKCMPTEDLEQFIVMLIATYKLNWPKIAMTMALKGPEYHDQMMQAKLAGDAAIQLRKTSNTPPHSNPDPQ